MKKITFLKNTDLINEYLADENLNEMDFYTSQLIEDKVIKEADSRMTNNIEYTFINGYIGIVDDVVVERIIFDGATHFAVNLTVDAELYVEFDSPIYIVKTERYN